MVSNKIFQLNGLEMAVQDAIQSSFMGSGFDDVDPHFWATTKLKDSVEHGIKRWAVQNRGSHIGGNLGVGDPPGQGFKITFGFKILLNYKVRFKTNVDLGYGYRNGNIGGTGSLHLSIYNGGLGVGVGKHNLVYDVTAAAILTVGGGNGMPLQSYSLNYNSPIPILNGFKKSFSYGQALTYNSALNHKNEFSLNNIQREGLIGFRIFDINVSSNNDTKRAYFGGGTDMGWTGGISLATPFMELGFQDFTGDYKKTDTYGLREEIVNDIKEIKKDPFLTKEEEKIQIGRLQNKLDNLLSQNPYHSQTPYQKNLNKASTYIRFNRNGYSTTVDVIGAAWLQNFIHKQIKDFRFQYDHKKIETWDGSSW